MLPIRLSLPAWATSLRLRPAAIRWRSPAFVTYGMAAKTGCSVVQRPPSSSPHLAPARLTATPSARAIEAETCARQTKWLPTLCLSYFPSAHSPFPLQATPLACQGSSAGGRLRLPLLRAHHGARGAGPGRLIHNLSISPPNPTQPPSPHPGLQVHIAVGIHYSDLTPPRCAHSASILLVTGLPARVPRTHLAPAVPLSPQEQEHQQIPQTRQPTPSNSPIRATAPTLFAAPANPVFQRTPPCLYVGPSRPRP